MTETIVFTNTKQDREKLFIELYKEVFPSVARYVSRMGGSCEEAKDIFQDALVVFYEKKQSGEQMQDGKAYLCGIARHLWTKKYKAKAKTVACDAQVITGEDAEKKIKDEHLLGFLEKAGTRCMELLRAFYYDRLPMKSIATALGYSGERSATVQKYKCLEKVRERIKEKSLDYEDFFE